MFYILWLWLGALEYPKLFSLRGPERTVGVRLLTALIKVYCSLTENTKNDERNKSNSTNR